MSKKNRPALNAALIGRYLTHLREAERSAHTVSKYAHDLNALCAWLRDAPLTKTALIGWKEHLTAALAPASVNSMLAAVNGFLKFYGWPELKLSLLKIQKAVFVDEARELTKAEYARLVRAARQKENERLALVLQTICATGIRVSELRFITAEAVSLGRAEISNKGKRRVVFLPGGLRRLLTAYLRKQGRASGPVFVTRSGRPLDRSNIWREMKALCAAADVDPNKVFPHNLRHLFARVFYALDHDLSRLADILGHSSISTTRIYTAECGAVHARQVERLGLVIT